MELLYRVDNYILFPAMAILFIASAFIGRALGERRRLAGEAAEAQIGTLQGAILGLLALLLGFSFAMASGRYEDRKALVIDEANAIGTLWLRTDLLPALQADASRALIRDYVKARLAFYRSGIEHAALDAAIATSVELQTRLWTQAMQAYGHDVPDPRLNLYTQALNDVIDDHEKRLSAMENHVPELVLVLMLGVGATGMALVGYGNGLSGRRHRLATVLMGLVFALVIATILDMDRPRRGLIRVSQNSLLRLDASLSAPASAPAAPDERPLESH
jgi:hypothetical protein